MNIRSRFKSILRKVLPAYRVGLRLEENLIGGGAHKSLPKLLLTLEVQLAEHCNLNCAYCDHCSPLAEPELLDTESFARDMARLSELFGGEMQYIKLMGGEPLLNPKAAEFMRIAREAFPHGCVLLVTNGLLLPKQPESFWLACRQYSVTVSPTKYPVASIDYAASEALAAKYGVDYIYYGDFCRDGGGSKTMHKHVFDPRGALDPRESFFRCNSANSCLFLQRGRMYTCPVAATARHFSRYFGVELRQSPMDSIDIYSAGSGREILEFLARPIPFCRYCDKQSQTDGLVWRRSAKRMDEWTLG